MNRSIALKLSLAVGLAIIPIDAAVITTQATPSVVVQGSPVDVVAGVAGIVGTDVGVYDLTVNFDPAALTYTSVSFGDPILGDELNEYGYGSATSVDASNAALGSVEVSETSFDSPQDLAGYQPSAFGLFTISFNAVGGGSTSVSSLVSALGDGGGNNLSYTYGPPATIDIAVLTPEPSTLGLFAIGLGLIVLFSKRVLTRKSALLGGADFPVYHD